MEKKQIVREGKVIGEMIKKNGKWEVIREQKSSPIIVERYISSKKLLNEGMNGASRAEIINASRVEANDIIKNCDYVISVEYSDGCEWHGLSKPSFTTVDMTTTFRDDKNIFEINVNDFEECECYINQFEMSTSRAYRFSIRLLSDNYRNSGKMRNVWVSGFVKI